MSTKMIRRTEPTEHQIQCAIVEWAKTTQFPGKKLKIGDFLIKNANDGKRSYATANYMKKEGMLKGISDLFLSHPSLREKYLSSICGMYYCGLWIEVKSKKGKLSKDQEGWLMRMFICGYQTKVVRSVDEGIQAIKDYLGMK